MKSRSTTLKIDSYFTLAPSSFLVQEANGAPASLGGWDSYTPYGISECNTGSMGSAYTNATTYTILSKPQTPGGLPIINPACSVATSYLRSQPTRILYPMEIFRFQSASIRKIAMNGNLRYTNANMTLPNYGFSGAASPSGTACPRHRQNKILQFGPVKDFMSAPTQYGLVALSVSPSTPCAPTLAIPSAPSMAAGSSMMRGM